MVRKRVSDFEKIEADNLMEEASEIFDSCVRCGMREKLRFSGCSVASLVGRFACGSLRLWVDGRGEL